MPLSKRFFGGLQALRRKYESHYAGHPLRVLSACIKLGLFCHVFFEYGYVIEPTYGASMLPTLEVIGDWVLISKHYRRGRGVKVGDLIAFDSVVDPEERVIKRVIGMEGDCVLRDTPGSRNKCMLQVPEGHCWVAGDNLPFSRDSRHFGPMPMALIRGKVLAKALPFSERRWIDDGLQAAE